MLNLKYLQDTSNYEVSFRIICENIVEILGDIPGKTNGFILTRIGNPLAFIGDYSEYTTIYREIDGGYQFSNDGSVYVEPVPVVNFYASVGGMLDGCVSQEAKNYEDLIIPTPIADTDYEFTNWSPEIPSSGEIKYNTSFTAIFESLLPPPTPDPTLEERIVIVEEDIAKINNALGGIS